MKARGGRAGGPPGHSDAQRGRRPFGWRRGWWGPGSRRAALAATLGLVSAACSGTPPSDPGPVDGGLAPCPETPNCVHTGMRHPEGTEPLRLSAEWRDRPEAVLDSVAAVIEGMTRTEVVERDDRWLRAEATSLVFRFVDDVEVLLRPDGELVVRSASRVGRSDLGVNGRRVEELRRRLEAAGLVEPGPAGE